jgi:hypothetical protein
MGAVIQIRRSDQAVRAKRYRQRRAVGAVVVQVAVSVTAIERLLQLGVLEPDEALDKVTLAEAVRVIIDTWAQNSVIS